MTRGSRSGRPLAAWLAALGAIACGPRGTVPPAALGEGVAIALYARPGGPRLAVIDDRRWVEVAGGTLVLERVDPGAALTSLVIEALAGGPLTAGACLRDRIAPPPELPARAGAAAPGAAATGEAGDASSERGAVSSVLRCAVRARPGRYLVRLLYLTPALGYRVQHEVLVRAPDRAIVASRFAVLTPAWRTRAEIALFDGAPGDDPPPKPLARGAITLDGGTAVLALGPREAVAHLRRIYDGAVRASERPDPRDPRWARGSHPAVWVWLEFGDLGGADLAPGPVRIHVELPGEAIRDVDLPAEGVQRDGAVRMPLWIDDQLRGRRERRTEAGDAVLSDRFQISVANTGDTAREVWIEEPLRPAARRTVGQAWPSSPEVGRRHLRMKLTVAPGAIERAGFAIDYER